MKKLSKIKLNQFSKDELARRKLNALKGGCSCSYGSSNQTPCKDACSGYYTQPFESVDVYINHRDSPAYYY